MKGNIAQRVRNAILRLVQNMKLRRLRFGEYGENGRLIVSNDSNILAVLTKEGRLEQYRDIDMSWINEDMLGHILYRAEMYRRRDRMRRTF